MAEPIYVQAGANVEVTDTFATWIATTNSLVYDMGTKVLTTTQYPQPNTSVGGYTSGNAHVQGILSANTMVVADGLRGGSTSARGNLIISSNTIFNESALVQIGANTNNFTVNANNSLFTGNVVINSSKTVLISAANTTINSGGFYVRTNSEFTGARIDIDAPVLDITSNTTFTANSLFANVSNLVIGSNPSDAFNVNSTSDFNANVNIDGVLSVTSNVSFTGANTTVTALEATGEIRLKGSSKVLKVQSTTGTQPTLNFSLANTSVTITPLTANSVSVAPGANTTYDLGVDVMRWNKAWVKDVDVANTVIITTDSDVGRDMIVRRDLYVYGNTSLSSNATLSLNSSNITDLNVLGTLSMITGARVDTNFIPQANTVYSLGTNTLRWSTVFANNVTANAFTGDLSGNALTATTLQSARTINGVPFNGSSNITITSNTNATLTRGSYLTGSNFDGSTATTWAVDATDSAVASKVVVRDASGNFAANTVTAVTVFANTVTAALLGNASTATALQTSRTINGISFDGTANITITSNTTNALTFNNAGTGATSGSAFDGSVARTISYNTIGASPLAGSTSITTLGTITTGAWNGSLIGSAYGGTGVNNGTNTITLGGNVSTAGAFSTAGAYPITLTAVSATTLTLPANGTIATLSGNEALSNKTITGSSINNTPIGATTANTGNFSTLSIGGVAITSTAAQLNFANTVTSNIQTQLDAKAPLASPALTGTPTAPTATAGTNTTQIATTAFVNAGISGKANTAGDTFTGDVTFNGKINRGGSISVASWTTSGAAFSVNQSTYTDTSSTGGTTIASRTSSNFGIPTFASTDATTLTNASTLLVNGEPTAGANTTITNSHAIHVLSGRTYLAPSGSSAVPTLAIRDVNTGLYSSATGTLNVATNGTLAVTVDSSGNMTVVGDVTSNSDARLKENIVTVDNALDKVTAMRGVYFNKIGTAERKIGLIAQEVEAVIPEAVTEDADGIKSVAYANLVGLLIEALKDVKNEINSIKADINTLKAKE